MKFNGFYVTVKTLVSLNNGKESSLSEVLEINQDRKYYVSDKAIKGMIHRSLKWGRGGYVLLQEAVRGKTQLLKRLSVTALPKKIEELEISGMKLILRELTPTEKEAMQGFPKNWTLLEENCLETQSQQT